MRHLARFTEHWQLKLLSLVFAVGLWMFVASEEQSEARYTVPLELVSVPSGLEVTALGTETVDVRVRGRRRTLVRVNERNVRARLSLAGAQPGEAVMALLPQHVTTPGSVSVVSVTPARVKLTVEAVRRAQVDVAPRLVGQPAPGYQVAAVHVEPERVEVRTTRPDVSVTRPMETAPIDIDGTRQTVRRDVELVPPPGVELIGGTARVAVTVEVVRQ